MIPMPSNTLDIALNFLTAHPTCYIFPIRRLEKTPPCFKNELELASNDPKQIRAWHAKYNGPNWGIALKKSRLIVVDVDRKPGKVGQKTFDALELENGALPLTFTVRSPSGGFHFYFQEANDVHHMCKLGEAGFGKDIDSPNYVLVPGCWLSNSTQYTILKDAPLADSPQWFGEYLVPTKQRDADQHDVAVDLDKPENIQRAIHFLIHDAKPSIQGQGGDHAVLMAAGELKDLGISEERAIELMADYYNVPGRCEPLWCIGDGPIQDRLDVKVHNAWTYLRKNRPGEHAAEAEFSAPEAAIDADTWTALEARAQVDWARYHEEHPEPTTYDENGNPENRELLPGDALRPVPRDTPMVPLHELDDSIPCKNIADVVNRWVWVTGIERWVNRCNPTIQWKTTQFDSEYNKFIDSASISKALFKERSKRVRRFRYLAFRPGKPEFAGVEYNVYRASTVQPIPGNTDLWNEHLNYLFQDEESRDHVLNWIAWVLQNPTLKPNHALLIIGTETGTGKSMVARFVEQLIGEHNTQRPKNSSMGGDFNSWLKDCRLCIIEEVMQVNRRENINALRDIITEPTVEVNIKGIPAFKIPNYVCMMGVSNHPDALPLDDKDRRWLIVQTHARPQNKEYYARLFDTLPGEHGEPPKNPNLLPAVYAELLARDLKGYSGFERAPMTLAKENMIEMSRSDAETWLLHNSGNAPLSRSVVAIQDIVDAMPPATQKTPRLAGAIIPNFLREKLSAESLPQTLCDDGVRRRLWCLRGYANMIDKSPAKAAAQYARDRGSNSKAADIQAIDDFGQPE